MSLAPGAVLNIHADTADRMKNPTAAMLRYFTGYLKEVQAGNSAYRRPRYHRMGMLHPVILGPDSVVTGTHAREFSGALAHDLSQARTFQVSAPMVASMRQLYTGAGGSSDHLSQQIMPFAAGFAWLDEPWVVIKDDGDGEGVPVRALSWSYVSLPVGGTEYERPGTHGNVPGVRLALWESVDDDIAMRGSRHANRPGGLAGVRRDFGQLSVVQCAALPFHLKFDLAGKETGNQIDVVFATINILWIYLGRKMSRMRSAPVTRPTRRRALRSLRHDTVNVVTLAEIIPEPAPEPGRQPVDWQCRWPVLGHHRHLDGYDRAVYVRHEAVPSGPADAPGGYKRCAICGSRVTAIRAHIKGPPGKPLRKSRTLYKLVR